jgi:hypothetical protein
MPSRSSRAIKSAAATSFVFLNCPFDDQYKPIFEALAFTIHACGFTARCALEDGGSEAVRLQRIIKMIQTCQLGIHDLSRVDTQGQLPRFNMPFELGLFIGAKTFGDVRQHRKKFLVLEGERYQHKRFISDISGQDLKAHNNDAAEAVKSVREWLSDQAGTKGTVPGRDRILLLYAQFRETLPGLLEMAGQDRASMTFKEFRTYVGEFINAQVAY